MKSRKDKIVFMSLEEFIKHLATFKADWYDAFFISFSDHRNQQVIQIDFTSADCQKLINPAPGINRKTDRSVKPRLMKGPRLKRKQ
jgi:hypothetical protein